jgi:hypothetical protein
MAEAMANPTVSFCFKTLPPNRRKKRWYTRTSKAGT